MYFKLTVENKAAVCNGFIRLYSVNVECSPETAVASCWLSAVLHKRCSSCRPFNLLLDDILSVANLA